MTLHHETLTKIRNLVGDTFLYSYSPGDRYGTRYVFTDGTFLGRNKALKHAEELAAQDRSDRVG